MSTWCMPGKVLDQMISDENRNGTVLAKVCGNRLTISIGSSCVEMGLVISELGIGAFEQVSTGQPMYWDNVAGDIVSQSEYFRRRNEAD